MSTDRSTFSLEQPAETTEPAVTLVTLADVLRLLDGDGGLDRQQAGEMRSAVHSACRVLGADPTPSAPPKARKTDAGDGGGGRRPLEQH